LVLLLELVWMSMMMMPTRSDEAASSFFSFFSCACLLDSFMFFFSLAAHPLFSSLCLGPHFPNTPPNFVDQNWLAFCVFLGGLFVLHIFVFLGLKNLLCRILCIYPSLHPHLHSPPHLDFEIVVVFLEVSIFVFFSWAPSL